MATAISMHTSKKGATLSYEIIAIVKTATLKNKYRIRPLVGKRVDQKSSPRMTH